MGLASMSFGKSLNYLRRTRMFWERIKGWQRLGRARNPFNRPYGSTVISVWCPEIAGFYNDEETYICINMLY